jgi:hypothetical protein
MLLGPANFSTAAQLSGAKKLFSRGYRFVGPQLTARQEETLAVLHSMRRPGTQAKPASALSSKPAPAEDEWTKRMNYLLEHGTQSLCPGEAFMYSEETGEGVMFLSDGNSVRRKLTAPRKAEEVARLRRPDILAPKGQLQYSLSLLGKIIKPQDAQRKPPPAQQQQEHPQSQDEHFTMNNILDHSQGFFGWLQSVFKF